MKKFITVTVTGERQQLFDQEIYHYDRDYGADVDTCYEQSAVSRA